MDVEPSVETVPLRSAVASEAAALVAAAAVDADAEDDDPQPDSIATVRSADVIPLMLFIFIFPPDT